MKSKQKKKDALASLDKFMGNVSLTCKDVGISRKTFYNWKKEDEDFAEKVLDISERNLDMAESVLVKRVREGHTAELLFYLKTKGKDRGYVERQEFEGRVGVEPADVVTWADRFRKPKEA